MASCQGLRQLHRYYCVSHVVRAMSPMFPALVMLSRPVVLYNCSGYVLVIVSSYEFGIGCCGVCLFRFCTARCVNRCTNFVLIAVPYMCTGF